MKRANNKTNIEIIRDYYEGNRPFVQIGYDDNLNNSARKEGEEWTDLQGKKWVWRDGRKRRMPKKATVVLEQRCKECKGDVRWGNYLDERIWKRTHLCYDCFTNIETKMKIDGTWEVFNKMRDLKNEQAFLKDYKQKFEETEKWCLDRRGKPLEFLNEDGSTEKWESTDDLDKILSDVTADLERVNNRLTEVDKELQDLIQQYESAKSKRNNQEGV